LRALALERLAKTCNTYDQPIEAVGALANYVCESLRLTCKSPSVQVKGSQSDRMRSP
jgi:hypothetical protein